MSRRNSGKRGDSFTIVAFFTLGAVLSFAATTAYLVTAYGRQTEQLVLEADEAMAGREAEKKQLLLRIRSLQATAMRNSTLHKDAQRRELEARSQLAELRKQVDLLEDQLGPAAPKKADATVAGRESEQQPGGDPTADEEAGLSAGLVREWHNRQGNRSVNAKLLDCDPENEKATLLRTDGTVVEVDFSDLSLADVAFCMEAFENGNLGLDGEDDATVSALQALTEKSLVTIQTALDQCAERVSTANESDATTIQKNREYGRAKDELLSAIEGARLQVHFLVEDVVNSRNLGRDRRSIFLHLTAPDIPIKFANIHAQNEKSIEVVSSTDFAETLNKGSVIRVVGQLNEASRRTFAALRLTYGLPGVSRDFAYHSKDEFWVAGDDTTEVAFTYYIDHARKLKKEEADEYFAAQRATQVSE